jgi:hypothetical protein
VRIAGFVRLLAVIALCGGGGAAGAQPPARPLPIGQFVGWTGDGPRVVRYRSAGLSLIISRPRTANPNRPPAPRLTIAAPGRRPVLVTGSPGLLVGQAFVGVGRDPRGRLFILFQSYTGGAHCCNREQVVLVETRRLRIVELGHFDMEMPGDFPADIDGDGRIDFVRLDNRFFYAFASFAGSVAPPQILNIVGGRAVDVSAAPRYRRLFVRAMNEAREDCLTGQGERNGACAAYVAAAARAGGFDRAWREMLRVYERGADWIYPTGCRVTPRPGGCPEDQIVRRGFPAALRLFLRRNGYLPGRG